MLFPLLLYYFSYFINSGRIMLLLFLFLLLTPLHAEHITHPVKFTFINEITNWWPPQEVLKGMGVPGYAKPTVYNYLALSFWTTNKGALDAAKVWENPAAYISDRTEFGKTNQQIRKNLKQRYNSKGIKLMVSAFGDSDYPTTNKVDPVSCARDLATFVSRNLFDGVDIDWEDSKALQNGIGEQWLVTLTRTLKYLLPGKIITHSPQGPYFDPKIYKQGGYMKVHREVGHFIDFYNVQFYNQMIYSYDTYEKLFLRSNPPGHNPKGTSVKELIQRGIPSQKIIVGKPATKKDAYNTGWVKPSYLAYSLLRAYRELDWCGGIMFWQYSSDKNGTAALVSTFQLSYLCYRRPVQPKHEVQKITPKIVQEEEKIVYEIENQQEDGCIGLHCEKEEQQSQPKNVIVPQKKPEQQKTAPKDEKNQKVYPKVNYRPLKISYPVRFSYINRITGWWPASKVLSGLAVPGYGASSLYNYISLSFWTANSGTTDTAKVWEDPLKFLSSETQFGKTNDEIRKNIKQKYNQKGIKLLVSAFGSTNHPTTDNLDPTKTAQRLAEFVKKNILDGVDIFWSDTRSLTKGNGQDWLITFTIRLRQLLPDKFIVHSPQAPYFNGENYKNGGYMKVDEEVGYLIDFYNVQFFNQMSLEYATYETLFLRSDSTTKKLGTSVSELVKRGINVKKIVIGKPVTKKNVYNTGWIDSRVLGQILSKAFLNLGWYSGLSYWEYDSDKDEEHIKNSMSSLVSRCRRGACL